MSEELKEKLEEYWGCSIPIIIGIIAVIYWWHSTSNENKIMRYKQETESNFLALSSKKYNADTTFDAYNGKMLYWYQERIISNPNITLHRFTIKNILKVDNSYLLYCEKGFDEDFYIRFNLKCQKGQLNYLTAGLSQYEIEENYLSGYKGCIIAHIDSVYRVEFNQPKTDENNSRNVDTIVCKGEIVTVLNPQSLE
jgi:hypothetical protein